MCVVCELGECCACVVCELGECFAGARPCGHAHCSSVCVDMLTAHLFVPESCWQCYGNAPQGRDHVDTLTAHLFVLQVGLRGVHHCRELYSYCLDLLFGGLGK